MVRTMRGATESTRPRLLQRHKTNPTLCVGPRSALRLLFWTRNMFGRCNPTRSPYPTINMRYGHRSILPDCARSIVFDLVRCSLQSSKRTIKYRPMSCHVSDIGRHYSVQSFGKSCSIRFCMIDHLSIENNRRTFMSFQKDTKFGQHSRFMFELRRLWTNANRLVKDFKDICERENSGRD